MKICLIAEGNYPYVIGGVSNWINMLIKSMPEHDFIIYAIGAFEKDKGKYKYEFPNNLKGITEVFLDSLLSDKGRYNNKYVMKKDTYMAFRALLLGKNFDWGYIFSYINNDSFKNISDLLMSKSFYDMLLSVYIQKHNQIPFTEFFWNMRSVILPLFHVLKQKIPMADIYHSVSAGYSGVIGSMAKYLYKKPLILTEHGIYTREREEEIIKADWLKSYFKSIWIDFFYSLSRCVYENADQVVTLFEKNKEIEIDLGCKSEKIDIIPNGVDLSNYGNLKPRDKNDTYFNVGAIIRVVPIKDIKTMLQAFSVVNEEVESNRIKFYIMGPIDEDEEYYRECIEFMKILELDNVIFTDKINIMDYLETMDIMVLTSISEGQPFAILEGMACSKPFVTTEVGACREMMYGSRNDDFGMAGIVVPVMDYEKIGKSILGLYRDQKKRKEMGEIALKRVKTFYTHDKFINEYRMLYDNIALRYKK